MTTDPTPPAEEVLDVLVQSTYQAIKDAILGNRLRPGYKLIHQALAENLGVSRTPVRESLERLYQEGYVTRIANRGYFVAEIDVQEVRDLYQTREALEVFSLQLIFQAGAQSQALSQLEAINARYKKLCMESLSRERLLAKARERGMNVSDTMSDLEVFQLIFEAGFSTAAQVTDVSGRGVGMDVVRRNIREIGGQVEIGSNRGGGTRISIKLPLTLAILDGMSVGVGKEVFIIPLTNITESLQPKKEHINTIAGLGSVVQVRAD